MINPKKLLLRSIGAGINLVSFFAPGAGGRLAFRVFATPPKPRIRDKEAKFLGTASRLDFDFEEKRLAVYHWSADHFDYQSSNAQAGRPYVLLAYGWGYNAGRWRYFVPPLLEAGLNVIAYDPRGHGNSEAGQMEYPMMVRMQTELIHRFGRAKYFLGHSFGGGGMIGTIGALPIELRPDRVCLMGVFSDARWIFHNYRKALGLSSRAYLEMTRLIYQRTGRRLSSFDNARIAAGLSDIPTLLIHDPADDITSFSNAIRNHRYWPGSLLYRAEKAGHHLGTAEVTKIVMNWLIEGKAPEDVSHSSGFYQAEHELHAYFIPVEQDWLHGEMRSGYYA